ncbi:MAG: hypothetical protein RIS64_4148 [Bacteroidota bacterium]|jgi:hypothetical protein
MKLQERIDALAYLGNYLSQEADERLLAVMRRSQADNAWFTLESIQYALNAIRDSFLDSAQLSIWANHYSIDNQSDTPYKTVGLVLAGNIPLVGFQDIVCVFIAGFRAKIKLSEKDKYLLPHLLRVMQEKYPQSAAYFEATEGYLTPFDMVIATGSNNSARYFESYFGKYPNIIRRNRNAIAILTGNETEKDLKHLGNDVFQYYGLGCRNVSKLYLPRDYDFVPLLTALHEHNSVVLNHKYKNNFDHNYSLLILNRVDYKANGCILMSENQGIASPIACLYYEYYDDFKTLEAHLEKRRDEIQLAISKQNVASLPTFDFGVAQSPTLSDYADGVDVMNFLTQFSKNA